MKRYSFLFLLFFQILPFSLSLAQNTDSLWSVYRNIKNHDTIRLEAFNIIAWNLLYSNPDSSYSLGFEELEIARSKKIKKSEANALNTIAASFQVKFNYLKAIEFYQQSLKIREELGDRKGISSSLANIGSIYINIEEFEKALDYQKKSLVMFEEMKNREGTASALNNIGVIYNNLADFPKALADRKSTRLNSSHSDRSRMPSSA